MSADMPPISAILFDFGGTLDGPGQHWLPRFVALYRLAGLDVPFERVREAFGHSTRGAYADASMPQRRLRQTAAFHIEKQLELLGIDDPRAASMMLDTFVADAEAALRDSRELLTRLAPRARLGVISNFYGNVRLLLDDAGITPLLSAIVDSGCVGVSKPDPEIFAIALRELGTKGGETVYVGDSFEKDIVAAHRAGLRTAWLVGDRDLPCPDPAAVDATLRRLDDVESLLEPGRFGA